MYGWLDWNKYKYKYRQFETQQGKTVGEKHYSFAVLSLGKTWCPMWKRLGGFQELVWIAWKDLPPTGLYPWTVQPVAIPYTDKAIQTAILASMVKKKSN